MDAMQRHESWFARIVACAFDAETESLYRDALGFAETLDAVRRIVPALQSVIEDGVAAGVFAIRHSDEAARFLAALMDVTDPFDAFAEPERMSHHIEALTEFALRGLGCSDDTLRRALGRLPEPDRRG